LLVGLVSASRRQGNLRDLEWIYNPSIPQHTALQLAINSYFMACSAVIRRESYELKREKQSKLLIKESRGKNWRNKFEPGDAHNRKYFVWAPRGKIPTHSGLVFMRFQSRNSRNSNHFDGKRLKQFEAAPPQMTREMK